MKLTNDEFKTALQHYLTTELGGDKRLLGERLGRNWETVRKWVSYGLQSDTGRERVVETYPWLFSPENNLGGDSDNLSGPVSQSTPAKKSNDSTEAAAWAMAVTIKIELARRDVMTLSEILAWFLFRATDKERDRFRDDLGDAWKEFLCLTRAMTGETAFKITQGEGSLQKWEQQR